MPGLYAKESKLIDQSPSFPSSSLQSFKAFLNPEDIKEVEAAIAGLVHKRVPFQITVHAIESKAIYAFEGEPLNGKFIFWLRNITDSANHERHYKENLHRQEVLLSKLQSTLDRLPFLFGIETKIKELPIVICLCNGGRSFSSSRRKRGD